MAHGDETGIIMPPRVAPIQVVVVPIFRDTESRDRVAAFIDSWIEKIRGAGIRVHVDWREGRPGEKFNHWELKGVPLRLGVGSRDAAAEQVELADRLTRKKQSVPVAGLEQRLTSELEGFHRAVWQRSLEFRQANTFEVATLAEMVDHFRERNGFVYAPWCEDSECEARVKAETGGATTRNFDPDEKASGTCLVCGRPAVRRVAFAKAY